MEIIATIGVYGLVVLLFVLLRLMPETATFRPLLLFAARYTSLIVRTLGFLVFAALWNAVGTTLIPADLLVKLSRRSPIGSLVGAVLAGPFVGTGRILRADEIETEEIEASRLDQGTASSETTNYPDNRKRFSEPPLPTTNPNFAGVLLLSATAFHPAQITSLVWFFRESIGVAVLTVGFAVFVVMATAVFCELLAAGGVLRDLTESPDYAPQTGTEGDGGNHGTPLSEIIARFAVASGVELYHAFRVFILAGLVALALHVATPLLVSQWLHANPGIAIFVAAVAALILTPPVGGAAAVAVLFRGQIPLVAVFSFLLVAVTVRGGNLVAMKRIAGTRYSLVLGGIVVLLIAVLLFPIADLMGQSGVPV